MKSKEYKLPKNNTEFDRMFTTSICGYDCMKICRTGNRKSVYVCQMDILITGDLIENIPFYLKDLK
jgi:hypothetical protein